MLNRTDKSLFEKIEPPDNLIALTKEKMRKEKNKKHVSFYKYGAIAACFIIAIVVAIPYTKNIESFSGNASFDALGSMSSMSGISKQDSFISSGDFDDKSSITSNNFATDSIIEGSMPNNFVANSEIEAVRKPSFGEKIIYVLKEIISFPLKLFQAIIDIFTF